VRFTPYILPNLFSLAILLILVAVSRRYRQAPGAVPFGMTMLMLAVWSLLYAFDISSLNLSDKVFWSRCRFPFIAFLAVGWFSMVIQYSGKAHMLSQRRLTILCIVPAITSILSLTSNYHTLFRYNYHLDSSGPFTVLLFNNGPWYWVHVVSSYGMFILGLTILIRLMRNIQPLYGRQALMLVIGVVLPIVMDILFQLGITPIKGYNLAPSAFVFLGLTNGWALFRYQLFDIVPVARDVLVEGMSDGVLVLDAKNRIVDINRATQHFIGVLDSPPIGQNITAIFGEWQDIVDRFRDVAEVQTEIKLGKESPCHLDLRITPLYDQKGQFIGRLIVLRDITARKELEKIKDEFTATLVAQKNELAEANLKLQELDRIKANFTATLVHDLKSPLAAVKSTLEMLVQMDDLSREEASSFIAASENRIEKVLNLINEMLEVSRTESQGMKLSCKTFAPEHFLRKCVEEAQLSATSCKVKVDACFEPDLPAISADPSKLERVFSNLLSNAIKFTPRGGTIMLEAWTIKGTGVESGLRLLLISITDTGKGIPAEELPYIFEPYRQARSKRSSLGVGLGLAIVKHIVAAHGGNVTVRSQLGVGTRFTVSLPAIQYASEAMTATSLPA
jgi:PAS domain S-box-containing protein